MGIPSLLMISVWHMDVHCQNLHIINVSDMSSAGLQFAKKCVNELVVWPMARPDIFKGLRTLPKGKWKRHACCVGKSITLLTTRFRTFIVWSSWHRENFNRKSYCESIRGYFFQYFGEFIDKQVGKFHSSLSPMLSSTKIFNDRSVKVKSWFAHFSLLQQSSRFGKLFWIVCFTT